MPAKQTFKDIRVSKLERWSLGTRILKTLIPLVPKLQLGNADVPEALLRSAPATRGRNRIRERNRAHFVSSIHGGSQNGRSRSFADNGVPKLELGNEVLNGVSEREE